MKARSQEVLDRLERSAVKFHKRQGKSNEKIAHLIGCHRNTVTRVLNESVDKEFATPQRASGVDIYREQIEGWIEKGTRVSRMLQLVRANEQAPYTGGKTAFYERVRQIKVEMGKSRKEVMIGFEGLPGEYLQVDWGEVRNIDFELAPKETRYFFCARLKHSRFLYVDVQQDMKMETLLRCLLRCLEALGGVPWCFVFDNMKTVTSGRDENHRPIWNEAFLKFSAELDFHPVACWPCSGNQKGLVENLVKLVKQDFLPERVFLDDADLSRQCREWVDRRNSTPCQATERLPLDLIEEERAQFVPLMETAESYGIYRPANVSRNESMVHLDTNRYSVPERFAGQNVAVRIHSDRIRIYADTEQIANHPRCFERKRRVRVPEHFEKTLSRKPRARALFYREQLLELSEHSWNYVAEVSRRQRGRMEEEVLRLHALWKEHGTEALLSAMELATESGVYGSSYLEHILAVPETGERVQPFRLAGIPAQDDVDRNLADYDRFVQAGGSEWNE